METIKIRRENIDSMEIDAAIRIKDCSGFFDANGRRLKALLTVAKSWEVGVSHIGTTSDILITLTNHEARFYQDFHFEQRHSNAPFYREVTRVGLLMEKLALMIDPAAKIEMDFPRVEDLIGRWVSSYEDFMRESPKESKEKRLSTVIPDGLEGRIDDFLCLVIPPQNYAMGICHTIWGMKKAILRYGFNIDWKTPAELNPDIRYD